MRVLADLSNKTFDRIQEFVEADRYPSLQKFIAVAVENQLGLEEEAPGDRSPDRKPARPVPKRPDVSLESGSLDEWAPAEWLPPHEPSEFGYEPNAGDWLWGQVNNVLAIKFVARSLLVAQVQNRESAVAAGKWLEWLRGSAQRAGRWLTSLDEDAGRNRIDAWGKSFPSPEMESAQRFARQYAGEVQKSGRIVGALPWLGLVRWMRLESADPGSFEIGLTENGFRFARLRNPAFDGGEAEDEGKLYADEKDFYRSTVAEASSPEREAFQCIGEILVSGNGIAAAELRKRVGDQYSAWSRTQASTNASGALARMDDVGLLLRSNPGTAQAAYAPSEELREYLKQVRK